MLNSNELSLLDGLGVCLFTAAAAFTHGVAGVLAGAVILAVATVTTGPAAFVAAHLLVITVLPQTGMAALAVTQAAVFPLLVSGASSWPPSRRRLALLAGTYVASLGVVWVLVSNLRWVWQSAVLFVVAAATISYAIHRYERVTLGLVNGEASQ
ncbi:MULTISPECIES: hypothetical protein [Haloferax]|uniref:hypothetical protein n=1 Tax=Haloferax TaxID=2251 RepID=UPI001CD986F2|nr:MULTISPECIES: hypothetical protein [Haloferax]